MCVFLYKFGIYWHNNKFCYLFLLAWMFCLIIPTQFQYWELPICIQDKTIFDDKRSGCWKNNNFLLHLITTTVSLLTMKISHFCKNCFEQYEYVCVQWFVSTFGDWISLHKQTQNMPSFVCQYYHKNENN